MKLIRCYVSSFGKLKDFTFDFNAKLNTIKEDNGWGKSTFATFIKSMFYGLNDTKRSVAENERTKYKPWNSTERFGGYLVFSWGDKQYKLERFFGNKEAEDTVCLYDAISGKVLSNDKDWGKRIFQIDEEGFLSTTYLSQKDFHAKSNASLTEKYNKICDLDDTLAVDKVIQKIDDKAKKYEYSGGRGIIPETKNQIFHLEEEIKKAENSVETLKNINADIELLNEDIKALENKSSKLYGEIEKANRAEAVALKKENYNRLIRERKELIDKQNCALEILNGKTVDKAEVERLQNLNHELIKIETSAQNVEEDIAKLYSILPSKQKNSFALSVGLFIITAFLLLAGVMTLSIEILPFVFFGASGMMLALSLAVTYLTVKNNKQINNDANTLLLQEKVNWLNLATQKQKEIKDTLDNFLSAFNLEQSIDYTCALNNLLRVWEVWLEVSQKLKSVENELSKFDLTEINHSSNQNLENIDFLKAEYQKVNFELKQKVEQINKKKSSLSWYEDLASKFTDLESEKARLAQNVLEYEEDKKILKLTSKFLKQADENLKLRYKAPLQERINKYFALVNSQEKSVNIDVDFNVTIEEKGQEKVVDYYSKGYQNLFEICKRLALIDVLFTGEKPFIILDDPFYNLDDDKLSKALSLINKMADDYQILYLVCHESRRVN